MPSTRRRKPLPPTRRDYDANEVVSALQKACRRSQPRKAVYWAVELDESGYTAWAWKRLKIIASEDCGPAAPGLAADVRALYENWREHKATDPRGGMYLTHAALLCAMAPKSRAACWGLIVAQSDYHPRVDIPDEALDQHTLRGKKMGRGIEHFIESGATLIQPDEEALVDYEDEMQELFQRHVENDPELPQNPFDKGHAGQSELPNWR